MVHQVTNFLLRWLFLCRLVDDRTEVQTWPYRPPGYYEHHPPLPPNQYPPKHEPQQQQQKHQEESIESTPIMDIPTYRESIIRSITSYPPGSTERLQKLDELRLQSVREFAQQLLHADEIIRWGTQKGYSNEIPQQHYTHRSDNRSDLDADDEIQNEFEQLMKDTHSETLSHSRSRWNFLHDQESNFPADNDSKSDSLNQVYSPTSNPLKGFTSDQIKHSIASAHKLISEARDFLPQLVSTVLHSPPALLSDSLCPDPISSLRSLIIHRCQTNPSLGIELCWLLEAEVGRKWKALFEHRQQTGKRLILIVQADIAAAIATIGAEKASAFNLLQDAEMATAFGMERMYEDHMGNIHNQHYPFAPYTSPNAADTLGNSASRQPRSISDLRCRHFGDSMHFVDRLTQISLDLRHVPPIHRRSHLQSRLAELNHRLCRRMATRGRISIDVESVEEGGQMFTSCSENNVREDMIRHSVHFPMEPQSVRWPGGLDAAKSDFEHPSKRNGVVRTLRVLPDLCRVLDSRERCPFLVRMEVAETGLEANDARLYAEDVQPGVGLTIEESLGSMRPHGNSILKDSVMINGGFPSCEIPPELMREREVETTAESSPSTNRGNCCESVHSSNDKAVLSRGGYQEGSETYYESPDMHGTFDMMQEQYYDQTSHDLHHQRDHEYYQSTPPATYSTPSVSMGPELLDRVFGRPWADECETIRKQSPYRNVKGWRLASFIIKAGEDIRKEALVMQIMSKLWTYFQEEIPPHLRPFLRPYTIMCTGGDAGIVECLPDVKSVNEVKKETDGFTTLNDFFERAFGPFPPFKPGMPPTSAPTVSLEKARDNFLRSLVGYSVVCYILQIKDRHNANILMDREGHIMHIDFGFVLGETPKMGKVPLFSERAPFKLSAEFWEVIGGWKNFKRFCEMFEVAYAVAASHSDEICSLVEAAIMNVSRNADLARSLAASVRGRLQMMNDPIEQKKHIMNIVNDAITSWGTSTYDWLQRSMNGYQ